jgi:hypothetical protein
MSAEMITELRPSFHFRLAERFSNLVLSVHDGSESEASTRPICVMDLRHWKVNSTCLQSRAGFQHLLDTCLGCGERSEDEGIVGVSAGDGGHCLAVLFLRGGLLLRPHDCVQDDLADRADAASKDMRRLT